MRKNFIVWILAIIFLVFTVIFWFYMANKKTQTQIIANPLTTLTWDISQNYITNMIYFHNQALNLTSRYMKNGKSEKIRSLASATYSLKDEEMNILSGFAYKYKATNPDYENIIFPEKNVEDFYLQNIKANHETEIKLSRQLADSDAPWDLKIYAKKVDVALSSQLEKILQD